MVKSALVTAAVATALILTPAVAEQNTHNKGAREFAPGHLKKKKKKKTAKDFACGQQAKTTGQPAKKFAPGQQMNQ